MSPARRVYTLTAAIGAALTVLLVGAASASAHVTVNSTNAVQGGYSVLTFRVPTESDTASTIKLTVSLPTNHPLASVSVQPHPGWAFTVTKSKLNPPITTDDGPVTEAVSQIEWTATSPANGIKPGEFDQFNISVGPLPNTDRLTFPALQTYSDGTVVKWIEVPAPGSTAEPDHPAPTLQLTPAGRSAATNSASPSPQATATQTAPPDTDSSGGSNGAAATGIVLGGLGIILGAAALTTALLRRPRTD
jgi:uncharacterized protein YcnI